MKMFTDYLKLHYYLFNVVGRRRGNKDIIIVNLNNTM